MKNIAIILAVFVLSTAGGAWLAYRQAERAPGEIIRYTERRLTGHPKLEVVLVPLMERWRVAVERPVSGPLPTLGKGVQPGSLPPPRYDANGHPLPIHFGNHLPPAEPALLPDRIVSDVDSLGQALESARPGQLIEIAPGKYALTESLHLKQGGMPDAPIIVRARTPGTVTIESTASEGFHVLGPYWIFENLVIRGVCGEHADCEHAFHVAGDAKGVIIRNNRLEDFNAQIKVNGQANRWPDYGLIQFNTLINASERRTGNPVTPIDIVGASGWTISDNDVRNFTKDGGNGTSYGMFMKGGGRLGRIERNLIVCTEHKISRNGGRVGVSFGGGGTDTALCRDRRCITEHSEGVAINNVVAHCNDFGIDVNASSQILVAHNTLINTYGVDVRAPSSSAHVVGNLIDGIIRARGGALLVSEHNQRQSLNSLFSSPDDLRLDWRTAPDMANALELTDDFCGSPRSTKSFIGATSATCAPPPDARRDR